MKTTTTLLALLLLCSTSYAAEFAPVFADSAVLQREKPVAIWGTGRDGEAVTVELFGKSASTTVANGKWRVNLPAMSAAEGGTLVLKGDTQVSLSDIAVGEVWIGSGQSNMEWRLSGCVPLYDAPLASANDPGIRELKIPLRAYPGDPLGKLQWKRFEKPLASQFGAVAYFCAAELRRQLGVVVGVVNCSYGGTSLEAWMDRDSIVAAGGSQILEEDARKAAAFATPQDYEQAWSAYQTAKKEREERKKAGATNLGPDPKEPYGYRSKNRPSALHETMLGVIRPYTARGVLWYQGENNAGMQAYAQLLSQFITSMRQQWNSPDWPFLIGQISTANAYHPAEKDDFAVIREAQRQVALSTPNSGMVVSLDHGEKDNVHPKVKQPVGERFAWLALARVYGQSGAHSPISTNAKRNGSNIVIEFADLQGKLEARDPALPMIEIQDGSGAWTAATAKLSSDRKSIEVAVPTAGAKAVRYAWRNFCTLSLFTDEGLPVSPWSVPVSE